MISIIMVLVLLIGGILFLVLPEDKLVNKDKLKLGQSFEQTVKSNRRYGWLLIGLAV